METEGMEWFGNSCRIKEALELTGSSELVRVVKVNPNQRGSKEVDILIYS